MSIRRCILFMSQPHSRNSTASQSSSSGWAGNSAWVPRLPVSRDNPIPKKRSQARFTHTRAGSGFSALTSQRANASLSGLAPGLGSIDGNEA